MILLIVLISLSFAEDISGKPVINVQIQKGGNPYTGYIDIQFNCRDVQGAPTMQFTCNNGVCTNEKWYSPTDSCFLPKNGYFTYRTTPTGRYLAPNPYAVKPEESITNAKFSDGSLHDLILDVGLDSIRIVKKVAVEQKTTESGVPDTSSVPATTSNNSSPQTSSSAKSPFSCPLPIGMLGFIGIIGLIYKAKNN